MISIAYELNGDEGDDDIIRIAKKCGYTAINRTELKEWVRYDLIKNKVGAPSKKPTDFQKKITALKANGMSMESIAESLKISRASLYNYIKSDEEK